MHIVKQADHISQSPSGYQANVRVLFIGDIVFMRFMVTRKCMLCLGWNNLISSCIRFSRFILFYRPKSFQANCNIPLSIISQGRIISLSFHYVAIGQCKVAERILLYDSTHKVSFLFCSEFMYGKRSITFEIYMVNFISSFITCCCIKEKTVSFLITVVQ